ncbi:hypothetical protein EJ04DRAFT_579109 [Polyplosphaeria fusca]|uniref:Rhodopsin domain-containing protein n=1 Tax=Polyplosphaeria fusca TaxID=682080 RepID=A0A9P4QUX4_9PLEO|nr:hypothetical protein EJ04DRAFT_579109 [Polyplosphaeria fusca]
MAIARDVPPPDVNRAAPALPIYVWTGCGFATIAVILRLTTRFYVKNISKWEDFCILGSYLTALALYVGLQAQVNLGFGRHAYYVPPEHFTDMYKIVTMCYFTGYTSLALARTAIGLFLLRIVSRIKSWTWVIYFGLGLNALQTLALIILTGVQCIPMKKMWDPTVSGSCIPPKQYTAAQRSFESLSVVVDLIFALFPFVFLRDLQNLEKQRRIRLAIYLMLTCGLLTAICSIGRVVASTLDGTDHTWDMIPLTYWFTTEITGVLILSCLPALRQLFAHNDNVKKAGSFLHSKVTFSKNSVTQRKDPDWGTGPVISLGNIQLQRDVYVEVSDRSWCKKSKKKEFGQGECSHQHSAKAQASAEKV